jgi:hypothetical protein
MRSFRLLTAAAAVVATLGTTAFVAGPAQAASRSFSNSSYDGASWGTVNFSTYSYTADVYIYRDSSATVSVKICAYYFDNGGAPRLLSETCSSASNGGAIGSTRHVTLSGAENPARARIGMATTYQYVNGSYADGDWTYA